VVTHPVEARGHPIQGSRRQPRTDRCPLRLVGGVRHLGERVESRADVVLDGRRERPVEVGR
jgi:hypothetical protein